MEYAIYDASGELDSIILTPKNLNAKLDLNYVSNATINTALIAFRKDGDNSVFVPVRNVSDYKSVASNGIS